MPNFVQFAIRSGDLKTWIYYHPQKEIIQTKMFLKWLSINFLQILSRNRFLDQKIINLITINGIRLELEDGTWGLIRASSNKPSLVVVIESPISNQQMHNMFNEIDIVLKQHKEIGEYDQKI